MVITETKKMRPTSFMSSTTSSNSKRNPYSSSSKQNAKPNNTKKKKGAPLADITNRTTTTTTSLKDSSSSSLVPCLNKTVREKKGPLASKSTGFSGSNLPAPVNVKFDSCEVTPAPRKDDATFQCTPVIPAPIDMDVSPSNSDGNSIACDESMSTCDSFSGPEVEYIDNNEIRAVGSINKNTVSNLYISDKTDGREDMCRGDAPTDMETEGKIVNVDENCEDPQLCAAIACDIYKYLRASEAKKRPSKDFMEKVQKDINASMRGVLVDWLVEVAEEYRLQPDTLYLTVNYIDRYLSGNVMKRQQLQLLGVACMMIASKYEEISAPQVEEFCYVTDNTYVRDEVLEMECSVLNYLKFEMTAPTAKCFLRRFVRIASRAYSISEAPMMQLRCMANYLTELSLVEYNMLHYPPSLIAASAVFLAQYILFPARHPWNPTLQHYTQYLPLDLLECVMDLHRLCRNVKSSTLPAVREKYSQHKHKFAAKKLCPPTIPSEFFHDQNC